MELESARNFLASHFLLQFLPDSLFELYLALDRHSEEYLSIVPSPPTTVPHLLKALLEHQANLLVAEILHLVITKCLLKERIAFESG